MLFEHVICKRSEPDNITTDYSEEITSQFWGMVCIHLTINHWLSTAFHLYTDGENERHSQMIEQTLRAFCNNKQDNWVKLLPLADFTHSNSIHHCVLMTPFWANYHYHPTINFQPPKVPSFRSQVQPDSWMAGVDETHRILLEDINNGSEATNDVCG